MAGKLSDTLNKSRAALIRLTSRNRKALRDMPPGLYDDWVRSAHIEFKGIPTDAFFYARAAEALLTFFECVKRHNMPCALPSKAADSVWHAWLRHSPATLDAFCERHFGRRIAHVEAGDMSGGMQLPMARSLVTARLLERRNLAGPGVPGLFATDRKLRMPGGFAYHERRGFMVLSDMDERGVPAHAAQVPPGTDPWSLFDAGLIGSHDLNRWRERCLRSDTGSSTAGFDSGWSGDASGCDGGSSDGGSSGDGGSCGSGCGGCGGGGGD